MHFYAFFNHFYGLIFEISLRINPLFFPYIDQELIAQNTNLALSALRSFSYIALLLRKSGFAQERRAIEQFERAKRPALILS